MSAYEGWAVVTRTMHIFVAVYNVSCRQFVYAISGRYDDIRAEHSVKEKVKAKKRPTKAVSSTGA
jgi:hypothetical protein